MARNPHLEQRTPLPRPSNQLPRWGRYLIPMAVLSMLVALSVLLNVPAVQARSNEQAAAPKGYVGLFGDNAVAVFDTGTNQVLGTISVPPGPHGLVITPDGRTVYVSSDGASTVSLIDTATDRVTGSIEVGLTPHGLAITPDGRYVLAGVYGSDQVVRINTSTNQIDGRASVPKPHNFAISPDGRTAYISSQQPNAPILVVLNVESMTALGSVPLTNIPRALNFSPDGTQLLFTEAGVDAVQVLDPPTNRIVAQIPVGASPHYPLFTPTGDLALVVVQGPGQLSIFNPGNLAVVGTVPVGMLPHWIALSPDGGTAYVTDENSNDVSVVNLGSQQVTATIPIGRAPRKIVVQPGTTSATPGAAPATGPGATTTPTPGPALTSPVSTATPTLSPALLGPGATATPAPAPALTGPGATDSSTPDSATTGAGVAATPATPGPGNAVGGGVSISNFAFSPPEVTVPAGTTVTWTNNDSVTHTVTGDDGTWDSGPLQPGATYSRTFNQPGSYSYHCSIHPFMQGKVAVKG